MAATADSPLLADDRSAIEALLSEFYWRLDHPGSGTVADLFTEAGTIVTPRFELAGRAAIAQWFATRAQRTTRHHWSNLRLTRAADGSVAVDAYLSTAAAPASAASAAAEVMISETHDIVVRDEEGAWQFAARKLSVVFEGRLSAGAAHAP
jgi:hypothetical protein